MHARQVDRDVKHIFAGLQGLWLCNAIFFGTMFILRMIPLPHKAYRHTVLPGNIMAGQQGKGCIPMCVPTSQHATA